MRVRPAPPTAEHALERGGVPDVRLSDLPGFLKLSRAILAVQASSLIAVCAVGLSLDSSERNDVGRITGWGDSLVILVIAAGALGAVMIGLAIMTARRSRFGRWLARMSERRRRYSSRSISPRRTGDPVHRARSRSGAEAVAVVAPEAGAASGSRRPQ